MFALIVFDYVLLFDLTRHYGIFELKSVNLNGYKILNNYYEIITYYQKNFFKEKEVMKIEQYSNFLYRICVNYLKEYQSSLA